MPSVGLRRLEHLEYRTILQPCFYNDFIRSQINVEQCSQGLCSQVVLYNFYRAFITTIQYIELLQLQSLEC